MEYQLCFTVIVCANLGVPNGDQSISHSLFVMVKATIQMPTYLGNYTIWDSKYLHRFPIVMGLSFEFPIHRMAFYG